MKSKTFLNALAEKITKDPTCKLTKKPKRLKKAFKQAIGLLKEGKLKDTLLEKFDDKFVELQNLIEKNVGSKSDSLYLGEKSSHKEEEKVRLDSQSHPYNLYAHTKRHRICEEALAGLKDAERAYIYQSYLRNAILFLDNGEALDVARKCLECQSHASDFKNLMRILCTCLLGGVSSSCPKKLQKIMDLFQKEFAEVAQSEVVSGDTEENTSTQSLGALRQTGQQFLHFFHRKYHAVGQDFQSSPFYADLMASMLATYLDMCLTIKQRDAEDPAVTKKHVCSFVLQLLGLDIYHSFDVLLQLERLSGNDQADLILPLAKHVLEKLENTTCPRLYTKFVLTARMILQQFSQEDTDMLRQKVMQVAAPNSFLNWIQERSITDNFPETKHFRKTKITRFIVEELDDETVEKMLDLLSEGQPSNGEPQEVTTSDVPEPQDNKSVSQEEDPIFVIDKAPDARSKHYLDDILKTSEIELKGDESDVDVTELDNDDDDEMEEDDLDHQSQVDKNNTNSQGETEVEEFYVDIDQVLDIDMPECTVQKENGNVVFKSYVSSTKAKTSPKNLSGVSTQNGEETQKRVNSVSNLVIGEKPNGHNNQSVRTAGTPLRPDDLVAPSMSSEDDYLTPENGFHQAMMKALSTPIPKGSPDSTSVVPAVSDSPKKGSPNKRKSLSPRKRIKDSGTVPSDSPSSSRQESDQKSPEGSNLVTWSTEVIQSSEDSSVDGTPRAERIHPEVFSPGNCVPRLHLEVSSPEVQYGGRPSGAGEPDGSRKEAPPSSTKLSSREAVCSDSDITSVASVAPGSSTDEETGSIHKRRKVDMRRSSPKINLSLSSPRSTTNTTSEGSASPSKARRRSRIPEDPVIQPLTRSRNRTDSESSATSVSEVPTQKYASSTVASNSDTDQSFKPYSIYADVPMNKQVKKILEEERVPPKKRKTSTAEMVCALKESRRAENEESSRQRRQSVPGKIESNAEATFTSPHKARRRSGLPADPAKRPVTRSRTRTDSESSVVSISDMPTPTPRQDNSKVEQSLEKADDQSDRVLTPGSRRRTQPVPTDTQQTTPEKSPKTKAEKRRYSLRTPTKKKWDENWI